MYQEKEGIKFFTEPEVWLIGVHTPVTKNIIKYYKQYNLALNGRDLAKECEKKSILSELCGRDCYMSYNEDSQTKSHDDYMKNIIARKDFSLLAHTYFTFKVRGMSRAATHEQVRHIFIKPSQLSTRYVHEKHFCFVKPELYEESYFIADCKKALEKYNIQYNQKLVEIENGVGDSRFAKEQLQNLSAKDRRKIARGYARQWLPHFTEAIINLSGSGWAFREYFEKRLDIHADIEIYNVAKLIKQEITKVAPAILY